MISLKRCFVALMLVSGIGVVAQTAPPQPPPATATPKLDHFDPTQVDKSSDPCVDFYQYTCKKWIANNPIPPDQANWWLGAKLMIWNQTLVRQILETASADDPKRSSTDQKIGDYYESCINEDEINRKGVAAIQPELDRIEALRDKSELPATLARIHRITFLLSPANPSGSGTALFGFSSSQDLDNASMVVAAIDQGGLGLPDRDYYLRDDPKSAELRQKYVEHVQKTFELLGEPSAQATSDAKVVMELETSLAKVSMEIVKRRDPANLNHKLSIAELQALTSAFSWKKYLSDVNAPATDHYLVASPEFLKGMNELIGSAPLENLKTYLRWQVVHGSSSLLSTPFVDERFSFYGLALVGQRAQTPRWRRCVTAVNRDLTEALGQAYVARAFPPENKDRMLKLVHALESALNSDIQQVAWMSPETKKAALGKLAKIADNIGYPDHWRDYSSVKIIRGDALGNAYRSGELEFHRQLAKIGKPVDRSDWNMAISLPNANYDSQVNNITFPAAILQPPLFDGQADDAANFAGIGAIIGHELTHGFDDQGRKFDPDGNLHDWWSAKDAKEFERRAQCIADEYSSLDAADGVKLNGQLTLGENTADNGGVRIALMALENTLTEAQRHADAEGFSPEQEFFIAYGETWCSNATPQYLRVLAQGDPHATAKARVNGVVSNMPEFQKAFSCKKGQPMVRDDACRVW